MSISEKYLLTIDEAAEYTNIGRKKIVEILNSKPDLAVMNGVKRLVKRKELEKYLDKILVL